MANSVFEKPTQDVEGCNTSHATHIHVQQGSYTRHRSKLQSIGVEVSFAQAISLAHFRCVARIISRIILTALRPEQPRH